jgi:hypothetical protein
MVGEGGEKIFALKCRRKEKECSAAIGLMEEYGVPADINSGGR